MTTATRKQRTVRLVKNGESTALVLREQRGAVKQVDCYFLTQTPDSVILSKHEGTRYEVRARTCSCKGFTFHGHCKHRESLIALAKAGKLPAICEEIKS